MAMSLKFYTAHQEKKFLIDHQKIFLGISLVFFPFPVFGQTISVLQNLTDADRSSYQSNISAVLDVGFFDGSSYEEIGEEISQAQLNLSYIRFSSLFNLYNGVDVRISSEPRLDRFLGKEDDLIDEASIFIAAEFGEMRIGKFYGPEAFQNLPGSFISNPKNHGINGRFRHLETAQSGTWFDGYSSNYLKLGYNTPSLFGISYGMAITYDSSNYDDSAEALEDSGPVKGFSAAMNYNTKWLSFSSAYAELSQNIISSGETVFFEDIERGFYLGAELRFPGDYDIAFGYNKNLRPSGSAGGAIDSDYKSVIHGGIRKSAFYGDISISGAYMSVRNPVEDSSRILAAFGYEYALGFLNLIDSDFYFDILTEFQENRTNEIYQDEITASSGVDREMIFGFRFSF